MKDKLHPEELYELVDKVLNIYRDYGKKREKFHRFVDCIGLEKIKDELSV